MAAAVTVLSGDQQQADPLDDLENPVVFKVTDAAGRPVKGVPVRLDVPIGGGSVPSSSLVTDSAGTVSATWTMGAQGGVQELEAHVGTQLVATATAATCDPSDCFPQEKVSGALSDATLLSLATYDSSGQAVHPDVVRGHGSVPGIWMAITPYPGGNVAYENPSIFRSSNAVTWTVPNQAANPVVLPDSGSYLSDPSIVYNTDKRFWLYYRRVIAEQNVIRVMRSADGVHWDGPTTVVTVPSHQLVSPTVVRGAPHAAWQMWSVNAGPTGCSAPTTRIERRTSADGVNWDDAAPVNLVQPGQAIWHIDVQWIPARAEYWALYNTYPMGNTCATNALYVARSPDGITWTTYPSPIATAGLIDAFRHIIYRSTFLANPKATTVILWISGAVYAQQTGYTWRTATVASSAADLFAIASAPGASLRIPPVFAGLPPPEPDVGH